MAEWKIARRRDRCGGCESVLDEGERHASLLSLCGEELSREDLCLACFTSRGAGGEIFYWFTRRRSDRRGLRLDLPTLEQLFLRLDGREGERLLELRYLLCLILMRKKRLKLVRVVRDPRETLLVRRPRRDESLRVPVCEFSPERMEELRRELLDVFEGAESAPTGEGSEDRPPVPAETLA